MKRHYLGIVAFLVLLLPLLAACGSSSSSSSSSGGTKPKSTGSLSVSKNPPHVQDISTAKKYAGQTVIFYGDTVGASHVLDLDATKQFTKDTGIKIKIIPKPASSSDNYSTYLRLFQAHSNAIDVMMLDVVWPGSFAPFLMDLKPSLGSTTTDMIQSIVQNDTVGGRLVSIPYFNDFGMLYYRTDLLKKYGYTAPPTTWAQLQSMATKIQTGEKKSKPNFSGFVFQGNAYEGLTCDALEWLASSGGGQIIQNGNVTVNNPRAVAALNRAKGWVGTISPRGVTSYIEDDAVNAFTGGNAAFMRNWPYAYGIGAAKGSKIAGKFAVAPLPHDPGYKSVGTVGGWGLGISKYSTHPKAAIEFVKYMTSPGVSEWRGSQGDFVPARPATIAKADVQKAEPFLKPMGSVVRVTRPSRFLGPKYNQASTIFFQGASRILNGADASSVLPGVQQQLQRLVSSH